VKTKPTADEISIPPNLRGYFWSPSDKLTSLFVFPQATWQYVPIITSFKLQLQSDCKKDYRRESKWKEALKWKFHIWDEAVSFWIQAMNLVASCAWRNPQSSANNSNSTNSFWLGRYGRLLMTYISEIQSLRLWTCPMRGILNKHKRQCFLQWLRLALSKGPNKIGAPFPSPQDGNIQFA
jgi:hypothetical protein